MNIAIVGANRGIGLEFCRNYNKGHKVFAFCRKSSPELNQLGVEQIIESCDVKSLDSLKSCASKLNVNSIDLLVHVSGILNRESLSEFDTDEIKEQFEVNSIGPILSYKAFESKLLPKSKVAFLSSRMGSVADNGSGGYYGYRMSKAALNMAAMSLANDVKPKEVTVLILHPGFVKTDMTGGQGDITAAQSVEGLVKVIESKDHSQTGTFWHTNGEPLPW